MLDPSGSYVSPQPRNPAEDGAPALGGGVHLNAGEQSQLLACSVFEPVSVGMQRESWKPWLNPYSSALTVGPLLCQKPLQEVEAMTFFRLLAEMTGGLTRQCKTWVS